MFMPAVFHENLFDDFFDPFWNDGALERAMNREERETFGKRGANMMSENMSAVVQLAKIKDTIKDYPNVRIVAATKSDAGHHDPAKHALAGNDHQRHAGGAGGDEGAGL